ncbi:zinc protease [Larkinella arboricola]|uniref:Zinc protease n=1 Tax=Larkinella arboricola TaxID=643671 RepID=A0A327WL94_LARAB|nr:pitrilysin family protein [Larkinella arboricola]RAJ91021.1 zinc protease [Larkinella arboricola]
MSLLILYQRTLLLATFVITFQTMAQKLPDGITKMASVEGITEYQLKNGLRVLLFPDPSKPTVTVNITYLVGSRHEGYGQTGMAHLLEHMLFKGSTKHPDIPKEFSQHGARSNGTTSYDRTNYFETVTATEENLKWALDLEADRMVNSFIAPKDLATEFSVVRNELEAGENSPYQVLSARVMATAYLWHNYGKSVIGSKEDIERVPIENLQAFYKNYYQPDNAILLVAGTMDEARTLAIIAELFGPIPKPTRQLTSPYTVEPTQDGERSVSLRRAGDVQLVACGYHIPAGSHSDYVAVEVLMDALVNQPAGRLYQALVEGKKASYQEGYTRITYDPGFAYFTAELRQDQPLDSARQTLLATLDGIGRTPFTDLEVQGAKTRILKNIDLILRDTDRIGLYLSEFMATGDWRLIFLYRDGIKKVTAADLNRVAGAYFLPSNRTVGIFIPENKAARAHIPAAPNVADLVKDYKGDPTMVLGEAFDPSPRHIDARTKRGQLGKGLRYALLPKATRGNTVTLQMVLRYGDETSLRNQAAVAYATASLLDRGTKTHSFQQLRQEFDHLNATVFTSSHPQQTLVQVETTKEHLPEVTRLVADMVKNSVFPPKELETMRQDYLSLLEAQKQQPQTLVYRTSDRVLNRRGKGHPLYVPSFEEEIKDLEAVKVEDIRQFHRQFYGADNASVAVVGAFDEAVMRKLLQAEFGSWKAAKPYLRLVLTYDEVKPGEAPYVLQTPDKANAMYMANLNVPLREDHPDFPALHLANYIVGGGFFDSRLMARLRQKEGISYGAYSSLSVDEVDAAGRIRMWAIYNPENGERLEAAFREELGKLEAEGFTAEEVQKAQAAIAQNNQVQRAQDSYLAHQWNTYLALNRSFAFAADLEKKIASLTPEQVSAVFNKYISYGKLIQVKGGDFEGSARKQAQPPSALGGAPKK